MRTSENPVNFPSKMYVGFCIRKEFGVDEPVRLGFATSIEMKKDGVSETSAYAKRKDSVNNWARYKFDANGAPGLVAEHGQWIRNPDGTHTTRSPDIIRTLTLDDPEHPITFDNVLRSGFRLQSTKKRWGGHFSNGQAVWRVLDPLGFELEIYAANLAFIIDSVGIEAGGLIPGKCIWGRDSSGKNVLVSEHSETYQLSIEKIVEKETTTYVPLKDIQRGDKILVDKQERIYLGSVAIAAIKTRYNQDTETKIVTRYILGNPKKPLDFDISSTVKVTEIIKKTDTVITAQQVVDMLMEVNAKKSIKDSNLGRFIYAHTSKSYLESCKIVIDTERVDESKEPLQFKQVSGYPKIQNTETGQFIEMKSFLYKDHNSNGYLKYYNISHFQHGSWLRNAVSRGLQCTMIAQESDDLLRHSYSGNQRTMCIPVDVTNIDIEIFRVVVKLERDVNGVPVELARIYPPLE